MESTEGVITRVISHKPSKFSPAGLPYLIARLDTGETVMGEMARPAGGPPGGSGGDIKGERIKFYGARRPDRRNPDETVFAFDHHEALVDQSADGVAEYLFRHVAGIGRVKAGAIVNHFGGDTLSVLRSTPERAAEVAGFTAGLVDAIRKHFDDEVRIDPAAYARLITLLSDYKVPRKLIMRLLKDWGSDAPAIITANPYLLLAYPRMGWDTVDAFAMKTAGYARNGLDREKAAIVEALTRQTDDGHTVAPRIDVAATAFGLIKAQPSEAAWAAVFDEGLVAIADGLGREDGRTRLDTLLSPPKLNSAERYIARRLRMLRDHVKPLPITVDDVEGLMGGQVEAVRLILEEGVAILSGMPGTGKSVSISLLLKAMVKAGIGPIRLLAPTGKAAKRSEELIRAALGPDSGKVPCSTIHRALGIGMNDDGEGVPESGSKVNRGRAQFGFEHGEDNPLEGIVFVCEEMSMDDVGLFAALVAAIPLGSTVIFVGDQNQLPSVGPGSVLRDLIAGGIPTATLTKILRSDGGGRVVKACHAIARGDFPQPAPGLALPTENWIHIEESSPRAIADIIVERVAKVQAGSKLGLDATWDVQVISAQHNKEGFGCNALNDRLSQQLNRINSTVPGDGDDLRFRRGDKIIRRKNAKVDEMVACVGREDRADWTWENPDTGQVTRWTFKETAVVNGDMGIVEDIIINDRGAFVVVKFRNPDRLCRLPLGKSHLQRAYAVTVHSCVHPDTLVETTEGLLPIRSIAKTGTIATPRGAKPYLNFVANPIGEALKITTDDGYSVTVTPEHKVEIWDGKEYSLIEARDLEPRAMMRLRLSPVIDPEELVKLPPLPPGDVRAVSYDTPEYVTEDVAEFFGLMVGDGTLYWKGFRLSKQHVEVVDRFEFLAKKHFSTNASRYLSKGTLETCEISSTRLADWLRLIGGMNPNAKDIPECILKSPIRIQQAFLRGLFEDGWCNLRPTGELDHVGWSSVFPDLRYKVKVMLLRMGIISGMTNHNPESLYIYGCHADRFAKKIGFITHMKNQRASVTVDTDKRYKIPVTKAEIQPLRKFIGPGSGTFTLCTYQHAHTRRYISRQTAKILIRERMLPGWFIEILEDRIQYHHSEVKSIEPTLAPSMCVEVPDGHQFLQNGFPHGNSQGSGFPYVIVPVHSSFFFDDKTGQGLWMRELIYTALSRAEMILVTVGQESAIRQAVGRRTLHKRRTMLAEYIRAAQQVRAVDREAAVVDVARVRLDADPADTDEDEYLYAVESVGAVGAVGAPPTPSLVGGQPGGGSSVADESDDPYDFDLPF